MADHNPKQMPSGLTLNVVGAIILLLFTAVGTLALYQFNRGDEDISELRATIIELHVRSDAKIDKLYDKNREQISKLTDRIANIDAKVSGLVIKVDETQKDVSEIKRDLSKLEERVITLTKTVDAIEGQHPHSWGDVQFNRRLPRPNSYLSWGNEPDRGTVRLLRGATVQIPVVSLVHVADDTWDGWNVSAKFSGNRFTIFPEPENKRLVEVLTSNNWTPVDRADLSKGFF